MLFQIIVCAEPWQHFKRLPKTFNFFILNIESMANFCSNHVRKGFLKKIWPLCRGRRAKKIVKLKETFLRYQINSTTEGPQSGKLNQHHSYKCARTIQYTEMVKNNFRTKYFTLQRPIFGAKD